MFFILMYFFDMWSWKRERKEYFYVKVDKYFKYIFGVMKSFISFFYYLL